MDIKKQIEQGLLVSPKTRQKLSFTHENKRLETIDKTENFILLNGFIPILLIDPVWAHEYAHASEVMNQDYDEDNLNRKKSLLSKFKSKITQDYRTESSRKALLRLFDNMNADSLCISVGGGPSRVHSWMTNLNIDAFPNVDIVADAHYLPYSNDSVDFVHSEAVFEHLYDPIKAAKEIYRVLKPGKKAYICTPFLQAYHGYPHHYQNYTLTGHKYLFESVGFRIIEAGSCVGPVNTIVVLVAVFIKEYFPNPISKLFRIIWGGVGVIIRPLDKIIGKRKNAYILASTTYVIVEKAS